MEFSWTTSLSFLMEALLKVIVLIRENSKEIIKNSSSRGNIM